MLILLKTWAVILRKDSPIRYNQAKTSTEE